MTQREIVDKLCDRFDVASDEEARDVACAIGASDFAALTTMRLEGMRDDLMPFVEAFIFGREVRS